MSKSNALDGGASNMGTARGGAGAAQKETYGKENEHIGNVNVRFELRVMTDCREAAGL